MEATIKRICFTGPESSGKTTLAKELADQFDEVWVPEFARMYLEGLDRPYTPEDLIKILLGQLQFEAAQAGLARNFLFCDTGPLVLKVWAEEKFERCPPLIEKAFREHRYDLYVLCRPDFEWQPDPLRENPQDRDRLYAIYRQHLQSANFPFLEVEGPPEIRRTKLQTHLNS